MDPEFEYLSREHHPQHSLPPAEPFPAPNAVSLHTDTTDRRAAIAEIVRQIHDIPSADYETTRDAEMTRLSA